MWLVNIKILYFQLAGCSETQLFRRGTKTERPFEIKPKPELIRFIFEYLLSITDTSYVIVLHCVVTYKIDICNYKLKD